MSFLDKIHIFLDKIANWLKKITSFFKRRKTDNGAAKIGK